jgi:hypothetical protein
MNETDIFLLGALFGQIAAIAAVGVGFLLGALLRYLTSRAAASRRAPLEGLAASRGTRSSG